ncbi:hypothetical protein ARZXY2_4685 (plasmid) [Arthrobacter sp. ZXY-2]|nr:hypothetical protein ARZXY2_4685 [Arthrobacter sp. ZXY-2]
MLVLQQSFRLAPLVFVFVAFTVDIREDLQRHIAQLAFRSSRGDKVVS